MRSDPKPQVSMPRFSVTCIVLTKDNTQQLIETCLSILSQKSKALLNPTDGLGLSSFCELLIIDGSENPVDISWLSHVCAHDNISNSHRFMIRAVRQYPPLGVYSAMNLGLKHSRGEAIIFMNSGDRFYDTTSLHKLVDARNEFRSAQGRWPRAVFGQALIVPLSKYMPSWLVPDSRISDMSRWLKAFTPNHQTMLVDNEWALSQPFILNAPHSADLTWIRSALDRSGSYVYLKEPVARFSLGGISSSLPNLSILRLRLQEPSRTTLEKIAEACKFILYPLKSVYPLAMLAKSRLIGLLF